MSARSSFRNQTELSSLVKETDGRDQVADADGVFDGVGLGVSDGSEPEGLASTEAFAGSTVNCPLWAGPQALSVRLAARHSPAARRRGLEEVVWRRNGR